MYHLKIKESVNKVITEGRLASNYNRFMLIKIGKKGIYYQELQNILEEYKKPIFITHKELSKFNLNKKYQNFEGEINWLNRKIL